MSAKCGGYNIAFEITDLVWEATAAVQQDCFIMWTASSCCILCSSVTSFLCISMTLNKTTIY